MSREQSRIEVARRTADVTPSDTAKLSTLATKGLTVNADGNVAVLLENDSDDAAARVRAVKAGVHYPWCVKKVFSTGTTATGIGIYFD